MKLPKTVKIGTQTWTITERARKSDASLFEDSYGYTLDKDNQIVIDANLPESRKRTTLLHELLHALRFTYGGATIPGKGTTFGEWEHYFIALYEEPLISVLHENPDLVEFLLAKD